MNIEDLIYQVKKSNIDDLIPLISIKNDEDVLYYRNKGVLVHKLSDFIKYDNSLSNIVKYLYYENSFGSKIIYYNPVDLDMCETNIYVDNEGFQFLFEIDKLMNLINSFKSMDFSQKFYIIPERFRLEFILKNIERIPDVYKYFIEAYSLSDYGFEKLNLNLFSRIFSYKSLEDKNLTLNKLKDLPDIITVYRGIGDKSLKDGYSYTLNYDVARFFAFRLSYNSDYVEILEAKVKKSDIIEYIDERNEEELLILPDKLFDKHCYKYHSFDKFSVDYDIFDYYKTILFDYIENNGLLLSNEHDINHLLRVLVLSLLLAEKYNLSANYIDLLFKACIFHDIGRKDDGEDNYHGLNSYNILSNYDSSYNNVKLKYLMENHCIDDMKINRLKDKQLNLALDILKDADALDRQRFGIRYLNSDYLRLNYSKKLSFYAFKLLKVKMY